MIVVIVVTVIAVFDPPPVPFVIVWGITIV